MDKIVKGGFNGFQVETILFLKELGENNDKKWFEAHRGIYEKFVLNIFKKFVSEIGPFMLEIDPYFETTPAVDKTISRIYRDIRFSKDKSPYRSNLWVTFRHQGRDWKQDPVYFFEIFPDSYRYGMGFYNASKATMDKLRDSIEDRDPKFLKSIAFVKGQDKFAVEGEMYKRPINPSIPEDMQQWHRRKNLYVVCNSNIDGRLFSRELISELLDDFKKLEPLYNYLWKIKA